MIFNFTNDPFLALLADVVVTVPPTGVVIVIVYSYSSVHPAVTVIFELIGVSKV